MGYATSGILLAALLAAFLTTACAGGRPRPAAFRERPDTVEMGDLRGPFDGRVVDADNGRPVSGALVYATWSFVAGHGLTEPGGFREHVGSTDVAGRYKVPRLEDLPGDARLGGFKLVIYKRGFVAYRSDRRFVDLRARTDFAQRGHEVTLERWRPELSHVKHLRYVGGGPVLGELTAWELPEAAEELTRGVATPAGSAVRPAGATLDASHLLRAEDIRRVTRFEGVFDAGKLDDEPSSPTYDSVHLEARGRDQTYDVALRFWLLGKAAPDRYDAVLEELPGRKETNEVGDRSARASTPNGEVLGFAFLDARRGAVILVQCGGNQCRSHEDVLSLARLAKERLETEIPPTVKP